MYKFFLGKLNALKVITGVGVAILVCSRVDMSLLRLSLSNINSITILKSLGFIYSSLVLMSVRWGKIIDSGEKSKEYYHITLYWKSCFYNTFTPGNIGGDAYRVIRLKSLNFKIEKVFRCLIEERSLGLYGYVVTMFVCSFVLLQSSRLHSIKLLQCSVLASSSALAFGIVVTVLSRLKYRSLSAHEELLTKGVKSGDVSNIAGGTRTVIERISYAYGLLLTLCCLNKRLSLYFLTLLSIIFWGLAVNTIGIGLGLGASFIQVLLSVVITEFARLIPITPQGIGVREAVFVYVLHTFNFSYEMSLATIGTSYILLTLVLITTWPIGWMLTKMSSKGTFNQ